MDAPGPRSARIATALAAAANVDCVVLGALDLAGPRVCEAVYGVAAGSAVTVEAAIADALHEVEFALSWQRFGRPGRSELCLSLELDAEPSTLWIAGRRCLVGLVAPPDAHALFVALAHAETVAEFTRRQRDVARVALLHALERFGCGASQPPALPPAAAQVAVERLAMPVIVVNPRGAVHYRNAAAAELLADGSSLRLADSRLGAGQGDDRKRLDEAITAATLATPRRAGVVRLESQGERPIVLCILPASAEPPLALVTAALGVTERPLVDAVLASFNLTLAERRLARHLLGGRSIEEAANATNLKKTTARSYLGRIFDKTGCSRQSELVALFAGLVPQVRVDAMALPEGNGRVRGAPLAGASTRLTPRPAG